MNNSDENNINTNRIIIIVCLVALIVIGFYLFHFAYNDALFWKFIFKLSDDNAKWGTFGDYIGGVLNPIVSAFALYLAAKAYDAQSKDLKETQRAQEKQLKLAVLTALLNTKYNQRETIETVALSITEKIEQATLDKNRKKVYEWKCFMKDKVKPKLQTTTSDILKLERQIKELGNIDK